MNTRSSAAAPSKPELLRDRGEDEVGAQVGDELACRRRDVNVPCAEPGSAEAAVRDRVQALDELVRRAVLAELELSVERAVDAAVRPRMQPDRHAVLDVLERVVERRRAADEEREPGDDVERAAGRDVEHREEDPEVQERAAEVVRLDDDEHRRAPDRDERAQVLQPSLRDTSRFSRR